MWNLPRPDFTVNETLTACISTSLRDHHLAERLRSSNDEMVILSTRLEGAVRAASTYSLDPDTFKLQNVSGDEMTWVYKQRMARMGSPGRFLYDEIMLRPEHGLCPFCGARDVSTLDHYVPKTRFPAVAIDPANLVPSCKDCNHTKGVRVSADPDEEPLHPYYDHISDDLWLHAAVLRGDPVAIQFYASGPDDWTDLFQRRVQANFKRLNLANLYSSHAAQELRSISGYLRTLHRADPSAVEIHLAEIAASRENVRLNSWQSATYRALSQDAWFCAEGFQIA